jgi:hypothetical protein
LNDVAEGVPSGTAVAVAATTCARGLELPPFPLLAPKAIAPASTPPAASVAITLVTPEMLPRFISAPI